MYKAEFKNEIATLERDLDHKLSKITYYNKQRLAENKKVASSHKQEIYELK